MSFLPIPLPIVGDIASKLQDQEKPRGSGTTSAAAPIVGTVASRWLELHGENSWKGLLDPLDPHLRATIISYGEMVQATYDGFNTERRSPHCGACFYGHDDLLAGVGVPHHGNNYHGAAALGRRDIVVAWRGTIKNLEWVNDLDFTPVPATPVLGSAASQNRFAVVHRGFLSVYTSSNKSSEFTKTSAKDQVLKEVRRLVELYKDEEVSITVCGHSLGASLATLNAVDLVSSGANKPESSTKSFPVTAIVFASPHVGDRFFRSAFNSFPDLKALHVQNAGDIVPMYPPLGYVDVAVELTIRTIRSPYMRMPATVLTLHNLECYLHGVAGEQGSAGGFKLEVERDVALVNKGADALTNEHPVPAEWWVPKHKFMVKGKDGRWALQDFKHI
ncbi:Phospholipase A1-II 7 [Triticum urartu]|uniref:Phospholipase A1 n=1 Tax=Triticum urartu TaxID=4572 RepID=M7ZY94_TRIUA|nr:Phospholipase A1-II 7 [Triticum urartu]